MPNNYRLPPKGLPELTIGEKRKLTWLRQVILVWFESNGRKLPWRSVKAAGYEKICVEVLLQQTRAESVAKLYPSFFNRFSSWHHLAACEVGDLEEVLRPLGLWRRRAIRLRELAEYASTRDGKFPIDPAEHAGIPAVGQYVSNAIQLFQHGARRPLLDVNMARVLERYLRPRGHADIRSDPFLQQAAAWLVNDPNAVRVNWGVLDFAAAICWRGKPLCEQCPASLKCFTGRARLSANSAAGD